MLPQSIYIASSMGMLLWVLVFYSAMAIAVWISTLPWWLVLPIWLILALHARFVIKLHASRTHKNSVLILRPDCDKWQYQLQSGRNVRGTLLKQKSYCSRFLIILYMQHMVTGRYIVVPRDALSEQNFRFLAFKLHC